MDPLRQDLCSSPSRSIIGSGLRDSRLENYISAATEVEYRSLSNYQFALEGGLNNYQRYFGFGYFLLLLLS